MKRIIQTSCNCYKPDEYIELSTTPLSVFCKNCQSFIVGTSTEEELDYLIAFDLATDIQRQKMIANNHLQKFKEARNSPVLLNNVIQEFGSKEAFDLFITNMEHILNRINE